MSFLSRDVILKKIRKIRLSKEVSQYEMANQLNISIPTYSCFERGLTKTDITLLKDACKILEIEESMINCPINYIDPNSNYSLEGSTEEIHKQLCELIVLLEKQQTANAILLKKIKALAKKKTNYS
ncbi:MAG: helix-turn-helix domain-containing protein [Flavobacteriales bacterium]